MCYVLAEDFYTIAISSVTKKEKKIERHKSQIKSETSDESQFIRQEGKSNTSVSYDAIQKNTVYNDPSITVQSQK